MFGQVLTRAAWLRLKRSIGVINGADLSVRRSAAAVARSRRAFADSDPNKQARLFAERLSRCAPEFGDEPSLF